MIRILLIAGVILISLSGFCMAQEVGDIGLGIILGEPTGFSGKVWIDEGIAVDAALAWSFEKKGYLHIHSDYLLLDPDIFHPDKGELVLYYGPGVRAKFTEADKTRVGVRMVGGLSYLLDRHPLDLFFEIAAIVDVIPSTEADFNFGIGIRYYFHQ